jgi:restriction endonuclease S subunit
MNVRLGNICRFLNGGTPSTSVSSYFEGNIPWITGSDIISPIVTSARSHITSEAIQNSATNRVPAGTVLLVTRTSVGKVAIAGIDLCFSQDITALIPDSQKFDVTYLVHFLRTRQPYFERLSRGATIKGVTREVVENLEIPLPSLPEQRRIAAILDKADAIHRKRQRAMARMNDFLHSMFLEMFGDPVTNPKAWTSRKFKSLLEIPLRNGLSPSTDGKVVGHVLTLSAITQGTFNPIARKEARFAVHPPEEKRVEAKDFLICRGNGNLSLCGVGRFPAYDMLDTTFPDTMIAARINVADIFPLFLERLWVTQYIRSQLERGARTRAVTIIRTETDAKA